MGARSERSPRSFLIEGRWLLTPPQVAREIWRPLWAALQAHQRTRGYVPGPDLVRWLEQLRDLAMSENGRESRTLTDDPSSWEQEVLTTGQVAGILGCSPRQVVRLIDERKLGAERPGHAWQIPGAEVAAHLARVGRTRPIPGGTTWQHPTGAR